MSEHDTPVVETRNISKTFGRVQALDGVDLSLNKGEIMGLVGDNGAGKSTLIKTLVGIHDPDEGEILIDGEVKQINGPKQAQKYGISTVYQDLALVDDLPVHANIYLGRPEVNKIGGVLNILNWKKMRSEADRILTERLEFDVPIESRVEFLSGGERQAVAIGRALVTSPDIVILDEPTSALSADAAERVINLIKTLRDEGITVLLVSHKLEEIFSLTDRVTILYAGQSIGTFDSENITKDDVVEMMISGDIRRTKA